MGEESAADAPFPFFADFEDAGLRKAVDRGRRHEYPHHDWKGSRRCHQIRWLYQFRHHTRTTNRQRLKIGIASCYGFANKASQRAGCRRITFRLKRTFENHLYRLIYCWDDQQVQVICRIDRADASSVTISGPNPRRFGFGFVGQLLAELAAHGRGRQKWIRL